MKAYEVLEQIKESGVCAIVRGTSAESLCKIADALLAGGVNTIEVTFNTPGASEMIKELVAKYKDKMLIGAGTVLDAETARTAILSGAAFVLSPSLNLGMVKMCHCHSDRSSNSMGKWSANHKSISGRSFRAELYKAVERTSFTNGNDGSRSNRS